MCFCVIRLPFVNYFYLPNTPYFVAKSPNLRKIELNQCGL